MLNTIPPAYIEYRHLSSQVEIAEQQKDILVQAIKKEAGQNRLFLEGSMSQIEEKDILKRAQFFELKCMQCDSRLETGQTFVPESLHVSLSLAGVKQFSFATVNEDQTSTSWLVELKEVKPIFVHIGELAEIHYTASPGIEIKGMGKVLKNGVLGETVKIEIQDWFKSPGHQKERRVIQGVVVGLKEVECEN